LESQCLEAETTPTLKMEKHPSSFQMYCQVDLLMAFFSESPSSLPRPHQWTLDRVLSRMRIRTLLCNIWSFQWEWRPQQQCIGNPHSLGNVQTLEQEAAVLLRKMVINTTPREQAFLIVRLFVTVTKPKKTI
jgi:hypothetical protein